jgi:hypothetical protein
MINSLLIVLALLIAPIANAGKKPLDLQVDHSAIYKNAAKESSWQHDENHQSSGQRLSKQCEAMTKQIKALKGKPQRKFTLQQRYEAECLK